MAPAAAGQVRSADLCGCYQKRRLTNGLNKRCVIAILGSGQVHSAVYQGIHFSSYDCFYRIPFRFAAAVPR